MNTQAYWDNIYQLKSENQVGWFQAYPKTSMEFIELFDLPKTANIIDIGGGDSRFVDALLEQGFENIWVLDISVLAIEKAKLRLGEKAESVHWIVSDITDFQPTVQYDFWHDRAAFHFLTTEEKIKRYVALSTRYIKPKGIMILGTFSESGPAKCSGLEIKQYSESSLSSRFKSNFERIKCIHEAHLTPFNTTQDFLFCSFRKKQFAL